MNNQKSFRQGLQCGGVGGSMHKIDVPPEFDQASEYQGTLGHKVNHHFSLKGAYLQYDSPRYYITLLGLL